MAKSPTGGSTVASAAAKKSTARPRRPKSSKSSRVGQGYVAGSSVTKPAAKNVALDKFTITASPDFSTAALKTFLASLVKAKNEILMRSKARIDGGDIALDQNEMTDQVDIASVSVEQNVIFKLLDRDRLLLSEIHRAIQKIETGDYGYCEGSGDVIPHKRLELAPWTRYSVQYQEQLEKQKSRNS